MADKNFVTDKDISNYEISKSDFKLVQSDKKIHDTKFETKPTTFFKDALKRFRKNKSSVAGAFILGFLILLAIFLPIFSPNKINEPRVEERLLAPKLFASGTGFWDGTREYSGIVYDQDNQTPADFYKPAVTKLVVDSEPTYINQGNKYGKGGYFNFVNENIDSSPSDENGIKILYSSETKMTATGDYKVNIQLFDAENVNDNILGEYSVYVCYKDDYGVEQFILLKDWSKEYTELNLNISQALGAAGIGSKDKARLAIKLKAGEKQQSYILIKSVEFSSSDNNTDLAALSFTDATKCVLTAKDPSTGKFPLGYWSCTGIKNIYMSQVYYCSFKYDTYAGVYDIADKDIAFSTLETYKNNGWCDYNKAAIKETFKVLSSRCPVEKINSVETNRVGQVSTINVTISRYKELGYKNMPIFLFGTDNQGHDIVKKAFSGLRTSLILGVCTAMFCMAFGICWGAISGYFGGNVDLAMERFCDILGGVPWIVVMTLCILHLGNNFFTFFLALCLTGWMGIAARTRTQFYRFKGREYVLASRTLGASDTRLIFRHILPNALGTIVTSSVLMIPSTIFSEATLAYLNLGLQGVDSFGVMLSQNQQYISTYSNLIVFPAVILALMMISFNLFGNGLRDALNPSLKGSD